MAVRAKFRVVSITRQKMYCNGKNREVQTVKMYPVTSSSGNQENDEFFASTPSGSLELGCVNAEAVAQFELDKEYYLDFTSADTPQE